MLPNIDYWEAKQVSFLFDKNYESAKRENVSPFNEPPGCWQKRRGRSGGQRSAVNDPRAYRDFAWPGEPTSHRLFCPEIQAPGLGRGSGEDGCYGLRRLPGGP